MSDMVKIFFNIHSNKINSISLKVENFVDDEYEYFHMFKHAFVDKLCINFSNNPNKCSEEYFIIDEERGFYITKEGGFCFHVECKYFDGYLTAPYVPYKAKIYIEKNAIYIKEPDPEIKVKLCSIEHKDFTNLLLSLFLYIQDEEKEREFIKLTYEHRYKYSFRYLMDVDVLLSSRDDFIISFTRHDNISTIEVFDCKAFTNVSRLSRQDDIILGLNCLSFDITAESKRKYNIILNKDNTFYMDSSNKIYEISELIKDSISYDT